MSSNRTSAEDVKAAYAVKSQVEAQSAPSCSFCLFVLATYPTLQKVEKRDSALFTAHLQKVHGLKQEIAA